MNNFLDFISQHKEAIITTAGLLYEVIIRIKPTAKDYSIVNFIKRIADIIPNKNTNGNTH